MSTQRRNSHLLIKFIVLLILLIFSWSLLTRQTIVLVADPSPPYIEGRPGELASGGILPHLYKQIFQQFNDVHIEYQILPWSRAIENVKTGKMDGMMAILKTAGGEKYLDYTLPIFTGETKLWYLKDHFPTPLRWKNVKDLRIYKIGRVRDHYLGKTMIEAFGNRTLKNDLQVAHEDQLIRMLQKRRIDIIPLNENVAQCLIEKFKLTNQLVSMEKVLDHEVFYLAFSKKSPAKSLIPKINQIISAMKFKGEYQGYFKHQEKEQCSSSKRS